jgi:hypothetical protein
MTRVKLGKRPEKGDILRKLLARSVEGLLRAAVVVGRLLVDAGEFEDALAFLFGRPRPSDEVVLDLHRPRGVVLALVHVHEPLGGGDVVRGPLEDLFQGDFGAREIDEVVGVEVSQPLVHLALLVGARKQAGQPDEGLFGGIPVLLRNAQVREGGEGVGVVGPFAQRRLERLSGSLPIADLEEQTTAPYLHRKARSRIGDAVEAAFEEAGQLGLHRARGIDARQAIEEVAVRNVDRGRGLERRDRSLVVPDLVLPDAAGLAPRDELVLGDEARAREGLVCLGGSARIARAPADVGHDLPRQKVARVFRRRSDQKGPRLVPSPEARSRRAGAGQ